MCTTAVPIHAKNLPRGVLYRARSWYEVEAFLWGPRKSYALTKTRSAANISSRVHAPALISHYRNNGQWIGVDRRRCVQLAWVLLCFGCSDDGHGVGCSLTLTCGTEPVPATNPAIRYSNLFEGRRERVAARFRLVRRGVLLPHSLLSHCPQHPRVCV